MIALDTNVLVYAHREEAPHHAVANRLVYAIAEKGEPWGLPWPCVYEFLRVVTHHRVFHPATRPTVAWAFVRALLAVPSCVSLSATPRHVGILTSVLAGDGVAGNLVHDAHIVALCLEHGVREILTADGDFRRFSGLKVTNPFS